MNKKIEQYENLNQLASNYREYYNASYKGQPWKHFSVKDVIDVCIVKSAKPCMKYKYGINAHCYVIENFGFALIN